MVKLQQKYCSVVCYCGCGYTSRSMVCRVSQEKLSIVRKGFVVILANLAVVVSL